MRGELCPACQALPPAAWHCPTLCAQGLPPAQTERPQVSLSQNHRASNSGRALASPRRCPKEHRQQKGHVPRGQEAQEEQCPSLGTQPGGSKTLTRSLHSQPWGLWVRPLPKRQQHLCGGLFAQPALSGPDSGSPSPRPCLFRSFPLSPNLQLGLSLNPTFEPQKTRGQSGLQAPTHTGPVGAHTPSSSHLHPHWATLHPLGRTCCSKEISGRWRYGSISPGGNRRQPLARARAWLASGMPGTQSHGVLTSQSEPLSPGTKDSASCLHRDRWFSKCGLCPDSTGIPWKRVRNAVLEPNTRPPESDPPGLGTSRLGLHHSAQC